MYREFLIGTASTVVLMGVFITGTAAQDAVPAYPDYYPDSYQEIVAGSRDEGSLLIYQNMNSDVWSEVVAGFNELYPWIDVQLLDLEAAEVVERYRAESGSGRDSADLLVTVAPDLWLALNEEGLLLPYESPESEYYADWGKPFPGLYTMTADPIIFLYNKALLPEELVPTSMAELVEIATANPDVFSSKLTTYSAPLNLFGYTIHHAMENYHGEQFWEWYEALAPLTQPESGAGPMAEKVASGQYVLAFLTGSASSWVATRAPGGDQLLGWSFIKDGTPIMPRAMAIPENANSQNSAKLMVDYILSREGQMDFAATYRTVVRNDVTAEDVGGVHTLETVIDEVGEDNLVTVTYDPEILAGYDAFIERWNETFGE